MKKILFLLVLGFITAKGFGQMPVYDASSTAELMSMGMSIQTQIEQASSLLNLMEETKGVRKWVSQGVRALADINKIVSLSSRVINDSRALSRTISHSKVLNVRQALNYSQRCLSYVDIIYKNVERLSKLLSDNMLEIEEDARLKLVEEVSEDLEMRRLELKRLEKEVERAEAYNVVVRMAQSQTKSN